MHTARICSCYKNISLKCIEHAYMSLLMKRDEQKLAVRVGASSNKCKKERG